MRIRGAGAAVFLIVGAGSVAGCASTSGYTVPPCETTGVPLSADPAALFDVHVPTEKPERPTGRRIFALDDNSGSVYQYDTGRGRFLGPAPSVGNRSALGTGGTDCRGAWPGYPTIIPDVVRGDGSGGFEREGAGVSGIAVVAGKLAAAVGDGSLTLFPITPTGLGAPATVWLVPGAHRPVFVHSQSSGPGGAVGAAGIQGDVNGAPRLAGFAAHGGHVIALVETVRGSPSLLVEVDPATATVVRTAPVDPALHDIAGGPGPVLLSGNGVAAVVDDNLEVGLPVRLAEAPTTMLSVSKAQAVAEVGNSRQPRLVAIDLATGTERTLAESVDRGPLTTDGVGVWWTTHTVAGVAAVRGARVADGTGLSGTDVCPRPVDMTRFATGIDVACRSGDGTLSIVSVLAATTGGTPDPGPATLAESP